MARATLIQFRRDTEANWEAAQSALGSTPVLAAGELGFIISGTNAGKFKIGRADVLWASLDYVGAGLVSGELGGTGVVNTGKTITLGGNLTTSGAYATTLVSTGTTSVTLPTSGTLAKTDGSNWDPYVSAPKLWFSPTADYTTPALNGSVLTPWSTDGTTPLVNGVTVANNTTYLVDIVMMGYFDNSSSSNTYAARIQLTGNAVETVSAVATGSYSNPTSISQVVIASITDTSVTQIHNAVSTQTASNVDYRVHITGIIRTGAAGTYFVPKIGTTNQAASTFTLTKGSYISLRPLGAKTTQAQGDWS